MYHHTPIQTGELNSPSCCQSEQAGCLCQQAAGLMDSRQLSMEKRFKTCKVDSHFMDFCQLAQKWCSNGSFLPFTV